MRSDGLSAVEAAVEVPSPQVAALVQSLRELEGVVASLSDAQYVRAEAGASSIGAHVRHTLDHVSALRGAVEGGVLDYDCRERGTAVERDRASAGAALSELCDWLLRGVRPPATPLRLRAMVTGSGPVVESQTTLGRELLYVQSHTIHHNAIVAMLARAGGAELPAGFGYAPATLAYLDREECARSASSA